MAATQHTTQITDDATPARMAAAGVPLPLARWYHLIGRRLTRFNEWDVERVMQVRMRLAQAGN